MTGKKLVKNLKWHLESLSAINIPLYTADQHTERQLPCVVIGYNSEVSSFSGHNGHYTVNGYVLISYQGYEDLENVSADSMAQIVLDAVTDQVAIQTALNLPLSGTDLRPSNIFRLNQLIVRGATRQIEGHSDTVNIEFDAFCAARDFT